jgi:hypothetical protein
MMNSTIFKELPFFKEIWIESNEDEYFEMLGSVPPAYHFRESEMLIAFLLGEPYDHSEGQPRYHAFLYFQDGYYRSRSPMTVYQFLFEMDELRS